MRMVVASVFVASSLVVGSLAAAQVPGSHAVGIGQGVVAALPTVDGPDTSALNGSGLNTRSWPIDQPVPGGVMRKDPGSSAWRFVKAISDAELKQAHEKYLADMVAKHGDEPRDVMIEVNDTADVARLRSLGIAPPQAVPSTLAVRLLYRQLPDLRESGLLYWGRGNPRPIRDPGFRRNLPEKAAEAFRSTGPQGQFLPAASPAAVDGTNSTQTVTIWTEGFEFNRVPGTYWTAGDFNSDTGSDYWGDISTSCGAQVHGGSWSIGCNGYGSYPSCVQYVNDQDAYAQNASYLNLSGYSTYDASFYVRYQTEAGYDFFWWAYSVGGGWIPLTDPYGNILEYSGTGGWSQLGVTISNASHTADNFAFQFNFYSDYINTGVGVYVDDLLIRGDPFQPNLAAYPPPGWSGPIVPSSVPGTTTTGTLYAGQPTYIDWAVQNNGAAAAGDSYVYYYLDNNYIGSSYVPSLSNGSYWYQPDWSYTVATTGTHTLKMTIDATGTVTESNEGDNTYQASFYWNPPPPPDLLVQSVVPSSTVPLVGSTISATVTIKNQGTGPADGIFYTYFYRNPGSPPSQGQLPYDDSHTTFSLGVGATETYTVTGLTSQFAGQWTLYAYVDATNLISGESNESNNLSAGVTVNWNSGTVTASGTLAFDDTSYTGAPRVNNRPIRCVKVELWDSDAGQGSGDELLATTITDASGQFSFPAVANQDEADQGRLDLYVRAYVRSEEACLGDAAVLVRDFLFVPWSFASDTYWDIANGTVNLGTIKPLDYGARSALNMYDAILRGYDWAVGQGGTPLQPWYVKLQWQPGISTETAYYDEDTTIIVAGAPSTTAGDLRPNEWDNNAIYHEYAHHLAQLFGFADPKVGGPHSPQGPSTCKGMPCGPLAWIEGVSHFLSCVIQDPVSSLRTNTETNAGWTSTHVYEMDVETGIITYGGALLAVANDQGWTWETPVAGTLWDVYDARDDNDNLDACFDALSGGLGSVWDVLSNHPGQVLTHIGDFHHVYCGRYGGGFLLEKAFCEHGMVSTGCALVQVEGEEEEVRLGLWCGPNPARGGTTVGFALPAGTVGSVRLGVYDVAGRLIRDLVDRRMSAGRHRVVWDGRGEDGVAVRSGMYLCRLVTPVGTRTASVFMIR